MPSLKPVLRVGKHTVKATRTQVREFPFFDEKLGGLVKMVSIGPVSMGHSAVTYCTNSQGVSSNEACGAPEVKHGRSTLDGRGIRWRAVHDIIDDPHLILSLKIGYLVFDAR